MWVSFDWSPLDLQPESIALLLLIGHPSHFIITIITINIITFFNVIGIGVSIMDQSSQLIGQVQPEWSVYHSYVGHTFGEIDTICTILCVGHLSWSVLGWSKIKEALEMTSDWVTNMHTKTEHSIILRPRQFWKGVRHLVMSLALLGVLSKFFHNFKVDKDSPKLFHLSVDRHSTGV